MCEDGEVFFCGDAAAEDDLDAIGWDAVGVPYCWIAEGGGELCVVESWGEAFDSVWFYAEVFESVGVVGGSCEDCCELFIECAHGDAGAQ